MINTPGSLIAQNAGANTVTDNGSTPSSAENTMAVAGIESGYADIKALTIPIPTF